MLAGIAAILALALQVAGLSFKPEGETYTLRAHFDNIGGLKVRSPVKVGGVVVGRVSDITLDPRARSPSFPCRCRRVPASSPRPALPS
jgi:phospholipid/cholesterol/gamma-HCH transport system substrate-binding protein